MTLIKHIKLYGGYFLKANRSFSFFFFFFFLFMVRMKPDHVFIIGLAVRRRYQFKEHKIETFRMPQLNIRFGVLIWLSRLVSWYEITDSLNNWNSNSVIYSTRGIYSMHYTSRITGWHTHARISTGSKFENRSTTLNRNLNIAKMNNLRYAFTGTILSTPKLLRQSLSTPRNLRQCAYRATHSIITLSSPRKRTRRRGSNERTNSTSTFKNNNSNNVNPISTKSKIAQTLNRIYDNGLVICIRENSSTQAIEAARTILKVSSSLCIEVTLTTPGALQVIELLNNEFPKALIGAGSVLTIQEVNQVAKAGASFIMSPITDEGIVHKAHQVDMLAIPGASTPTEIWNAFHNVGAKVVKIFPISSCGGFDFVKALNGPLGHVRILPTSGVEIEDVENYLKLDNVIAVGASRQIVLDACGYDGDVKKWEDNVSERAKKWVDIVRQVGRKQE